MTHIVWTEPAIADLDGIHDYISRDSEIYADSVVLEIVEAAERLGSYPESGRVVPEVGEGSIREIIVGGYRVIHEVASDHILMLTVLHAARQFPEGLSE